MRAAYFVPANLRRHREKVLAHAEQQLLSHGELNSSELIARYKRFLKIEEHRLRLLFYAGAGGREFCGERANLVDTVLRHLLAAALPVNDQKPPASLALVAIGGYGRGELNPYSDVDVMFLVDGNRGLSTEVSNAIEQILYMLWDIGFKVGHSTRSIPEAIKQANSDMQSKTSLLEARLVAGDAPLFEAFRSRFVKQCVESHVAEYIRDRIANQSERHEKFGHTIYMQEPNIKNGCGGMRDYQNLLWISFFKLAVQSTAGLVEKKFMNEAERRQLERAYDFLLRVRTELHYFNGRSTDVIVLGQQLHLADKLGYAQKSILRRTEAFMRDYYQHARAIYYATELLSERMSLATPDPAKKPGLLDLLRKRNGPRIEHFDGFYSADGRLYADARDIFNHEPERLMRLFQHVQERRLRLSGELAHLVRRRLHLVHKTFRYMKAARETFMTICSRKGEVGRALRAMHEVDFLGRYIPEFGELTCLVQHEFFHRYTADEHTLVCIEKLDEVCESQDPKLLEYREIFERIEDPLVLYLAMLLHDTGKSSSARNHSEASAVNAAAVGRRLQLSPHQRRALVLLVDNHIAMSMTAQRRNLDDPATIEEFARTIKTATNLDMLMLLTLADGQGTGDENWSDWKESLVWQLYRSTLLFLTDSASYHRKTAIERDRVGKDVAGLLGPDFEEEIEAHFEFMPDTYFRTYAAGEIAEHVRLFRKFFAARLMPGADPLAPAVHWVARPQQGHSEVWICGWDRRELLARIAGSFSSAGMNILGADVYTRGESHNFTRGDGLVLDLFRVSTPRLGAITDPRDRALVEQRFREAFAGDDFDFRPYLEQVGKRRGFHLSQQMDFPTRITVDNENHSAYTIVDVLMPDRLGLLYDLLRALGRAGAQIALSRIATEKGAASDTFYITDSEGRKLRSNESVARLHAALRETSGLPSLEG